MSTPGGRVVGRRWLLTQAGRGAVGIAVLGVAACSGSRGSASSGPASSGSASSGPASSGPASSGSAATGSGAAPAAGELAWSRVNLGFVSAYVLVRGREAAVVDTGVGG